MRLPVLLAMAALLVPAVSSGPPARGEADRRVAPNPEHLSMLHDKCVKRMLEFKDWTRDDPRSIAAPTLPVIGDADILRPEPEVKIVGRIPQARLAVLPGRDHIPLSGRSDLPRPILPAFLAPRTKGTT